VQGEFERLEDRIEVAENLLERLRPKDRLNSVA
jgi:hypothetical protein